MRKWPADVRVIPWHVVRYGGPLPPSQIFYVFALACDAWSRVCGIDFAPTPDPRAALVLVSFEGIDGRGGTLAWTDKPDTHSRTPRVMKFDEAETWTFAGRHALCEVDFYRVALHEIGHALGIEHLPAGNVMADCYSDVCTLQAADIAEAVLRYGSRQTSDAKFSP